MRTGVAALGVVCACGQAAPPPGPSAPSPASPTAPAAPPAAPACTPLPFAESTPVPEVSAAAWLPVAGRTVLVVVGDSGQRGAYGLIDPESGATLEQGALPLGDPGDDLEGLAVRGGRLYGLTSAGWVRAWTRDEAARGFQLVDGPYAIGPVTLGKSGHVRPVPGDGMAAAPTRVNGGRNYEGLALSDDAPAGDACIGVALAKADGALYCLTEESGRLVAHHDRALAVGAPDAVADVALDDAGVLWVGDNLAGANAVARVTGWRDLAHGQITPLGAYGPGFAEAIAARGDVMYRMSDMGGAPSLMAKFRCSPIQR